MKAEFYKLNTWYKKAVYYIGWAYTIFMVGWLVLLILYIARDKTKKSEKDTLVFSYQKFPYWLGWIFPLITVIFFVWILWPV